MVFYDEETQSRPLNLGFVTPSVTTFTGMDPSYTIYTVDGPGEGASYVSAGYVLFADGVKKKDFPTSLEVFLRHFLCFF